MMLTDTNPKNLRIEALVDTREPRDVRHCGNPPRHCGNPPRVRHCGNPPRARHYGHLPR